MLSTLSHVLTDTDYQLLLVIIWEVAYNVQPVHPLALSPVLDFILLLLVVVELVVQMP
jgi:hypothetical protein